MLTKKIEVDRTQICARNGQNAIVLCSGGVDSTVSLWWALTHYKKVKAITINYNQPHNAEIECAKAIVGMTGIKHDIIKVDVPKHFASIEKHYTRGQSNFVISLAALDIGNEGADVVIGTLTTDPYKDGKREYLNMLADIIHRQDDHGIIGIATPLHALKDKAAVAALGYQFGSPMYLSWTCRFPIGSHPCFACSQCRERTKAFDELSTEYGVNNTDLHIWQERLGSPYHPSFNNVSNEIKGMADGFTKAGGIIRGTSGWRYRSPDGSERLASLVKYPTKRHVNMFGSKLTSNHIRVHGEFDDGSLWEVCVCTDGSVATTAKLPSLDVIEKALIESVEI